MSVNLAHVVKFVAHRCRIRLPIPPTMALFQKPAATPEEVERSEPLALSPEEVAELDEEQWYARVYRGDEVPQLTVRAVLTGTALGFVLAFTNVYVGLKTGWSLNVALTACIRFVLVVERAR